MGNLGSQLRRVLNAICANASMLEHDLIDGIRAAGQRKQAAATTDKCIKVLELQARLLQCSKESDRSDTASEPKPRRTGQGPSHRAQRSY